MRASYPSLLPPASLGFLRQYADVQRKTRSVLGSTVSSSSVHLSCVSVYAVVNHRHRLASQKAHVVPDVEAVEEGWGRRE